MRTKLEKVSTTLRRYLTKISRILPVLAGDYNHYCALYYRKELAPYLDVLSEEEKKKEFRRMFAYFGNEKSAIKRGLVSRLKMTYLLAITKAFKIELTHHLAKRILQELTGSDLSTKTLQDRLTFTQKKAGRGFAQKAFEFHFNPEDVVRLRSEWQQQCVLLLDDFHINFDGLPGKLYK